LVVASLGQAQREPDFVGAAVDDGTRKGQSGGGFLLAVVVATAFLMASASAAEPPPNPQSLPDVEQVRRLLADPEMRRILLSVGDFPLYRAWVIGGVIVLMGGLFAALFLWQKNVEKSGYFANIYREAIVDIENDRHAVRINERWQRGGYADELLYGATHRAAAWRDKNPMPTRDDQNLRALLEALDDNDKQTWEWELSKLEESMRESLLPSFREALISAPSYGSTRPPGLGTSWNERSAKPHEAISKEDDKLKSFKVAFNVFNISVTDWVKRATVCIYGWYSDDLADVKRSAEQSADLALKVDISAIQGRGPEFILEFTAIIVIIFAAVILGVGSVLDSQQIGTLLAAIAGYVLGKAASRAPSSSTTAPSPTSGPVGDGAGPTTPKKRQ
jgi:hypothetical protein